MKKKIYFIVLFQATLSCARPQGHDSRIAYNPEYVKEFPENSEFINQSIKFKVVNTIELNNITIEMLNCVGWENDPGDFRKIAFDFNEPLSFENYGGWVKVPQKFQKFALNPHCLSLSFRNGDSILVLFGYNYASDPGFLTIISLSQNSCEVIFNERVFLQNISHIEDSYILMGVSYVDKYEIAIDQEKLTVTKTS